MKVKITGTKGNENEIECDSYKIADGFLQIMNPDDHKELLIATSQITMIVVD